MRLEGKEGKEGKEGRIYDEGAISIDSAVKALSTSPSVSFQVSTNSLSSTAFAAPHSVLGE